MNRFFRTAALLTWLAFCQTAVAQVRGEVAYDHLGLRFTIPPAWLGQETENGMVLGSETEPGLMLMLPHDYTALDQLRAEGDSGVVEDGVALKRSGDYRPEGDAGIGAEFSGQLQGQPARAYVIGLLNPRGGGITIMAITSEEAWSPAMVVRARELARSVAFSEPEATSDIAEWDEFFRDKRLTYMNSYSSTDYGGGGGGYSDTRVIHLCSGGYFKTRNSSSTHFGNYGATGSQAAGAGKWRIVPGAAGSAVLRLQSHSGEAADFQLDYRDNKTYLNGNRYFVTDGTHGADYAADCP